MNDSEERQSKKETKRPGIVEAKSTSTRIGGLESTISHIDPIKIRSEGQIESLL